MTKIEKGLRELCQSAIIKTESVECKIRIRMLIRFCKLTAGVSKAKFGEAILVRYTLTATNAQASNFSAHIYFMMCNEILRERLSTQEHLSWLRS